MRICGFAAEGLRSERRIYETFPIKELQDYWSSRPKYEPVPQKSGDSLSGSSAFSSSGEGSSGSGAGSGEGDGQTFQKWLAEQKEEKEEVPPPPYSLEADEEASSSATPAVVTSTPAQLTVEPAVPEVTIAAGIPRVTSQTPASTATVSHATSQANPGAAAVVSGTYAHGGPAQQHPPIQTGPSYGGSNPAQGQQYPPAANTATTSSTVYHQTTQDPVTSLAYDYGRQSISGPSLPPGSGAPVGGRIPGSSPPPLHPAHPAAAANANPPYATGPAHPVRPHTSHAQTRPPSQPPPLSQPRPPPQPRPLSRPGHHIPRPQSQQGYSHQQSHLVPPVGAATAATNETPKPGGSSQTQWPPPEWGVQSTAHTVPHSSYAAYGNQPQPPASTVGNAPPSANIPRPQTFSASSYGANLRPGSSHSSRPSNAMTPTGNFPSSPISENPTPSSAYPGQSSYTPQSAFNVGPPQPTIPSVAPTPDAPFHGPVHGAPTFPNMPSPSPYLPPFLLNTYPGQPAGTSTYPGQQQASAYPPSNYGGGGWATGSPPSSPPAGMPTFSGQPSYGNNPRPYGGPTQGPPPQSQYLGGPSFPSSHQPSPLGSPGSSGGPPFFPQGPGGDGYFGSNTNVMMPAVSSIASTSTSPYAPAGSSSSPSMYPGQQHSSYPGQTPGGGVSYPQAAVPTPGPWVPSGAPPGPSTSMPPNFPPRKFAFCTFVRSFLLIRWGGSFLFYLGPQSKPPSGPSFPTASGAGSSAYGLAVSTVDKVAGRKTREQLENQVGSLVQSKLLFFTLSGFFWGGHI